MKKFGKLYAMYGLVPRGFYLNWKFNLVMTTQVSKFLFLLLSEYMYIKARCHYQSFLCQRKNFDKVFDETLIVTTVKEIFDQKL